MWKVLVVDDNEANRQLMVEILVDLAECDQAPNGIEAFRLFMSKVERHKYDAILLDVAMPKMDGIMFLKLMREYEAFFKTPPNQRTPVIIVTAHQDRIINGVDAGCDDYLLKPISAKALVEKIRILVHSQPV